MKFNKLHFNPEKFSLLAEVSFDFSKLPQEVINYAAENSFSKKNEIHITLIGYKAGKNILEKIKIDDFSLEKINNFIKTKTLEIKRKNIFHTVDASKMGKKVQTILEPLEIIGAEEIFKGIEGIVHEEIPRPFFHATYFVKNDPDGKGVGINSYEDFLGMQPRIISSLPIKDIKKINKIYIPGRIQTDTAVSIFLLKTFTKDIYIGIENASIEIHPGAKITDENTEDVFFLDVAGGKFDHHDREYKTTSSYLIAEEYGIISNPSILKLLTLAERCDIYGKGINSSDLVDQAFGVPGILLSLNRLYENDPNKVYEAIHPIINAHYEDEKHRTEDLPKIVEKKKAEGDVKVIEVNHKNKDIKVITLTSNDSVMSGFLRSGAGGAYDVVALWMDSGHINIITKQVKRIDLRSLVALIRKSEAMISGREIEDMEYLASNGRIKEVPNWYYDPATNTIQNGGINPKGTEPTKISRDSMVELLKLGLSETLWIPPRK